jgi:polar amino acid transport system permease protein
MLLSLAIGFTAAMGSRSRFLPLRYILRTYVQVIRGTPLLVQIYLFFYIIGQAWGVNNRILAGVLK